ncbi:hypothetical protein HELRODRAFT_172122 [Helobdella robusta]|uniref:Uncharacterized protein n=1 Tax=Helobdella robusta TaxID=6412 RepID=T1F519_HELRO|nr:hypothetical protein HELRODRAFT_172122 [Helobdella robusta]ESO05102.1 hypothetical protein HELRODRAFT_172122 [Helobdella robusta]
MFNNSFENKFPKVYDQGSQGMEARGDKIGGQEISLSHYPDEENNFFTWNQAIFRGLVTALMFVYILTPNSSLKKIVVFSYVFTWLASSLIMSSIPDNFVKWRDLIIKQSVNNCHLIVKFVLFRCFESVMK